MIVIKREMYMKRIRPFIGTELIKVMTGIRRCGEYYGTAEPPVRCGESHLSGLTEPPHFIY